jgi:serine protease Do
VPDAQNIGFAIPINLVKGVVPALIRDGRLIRPWIGFHGTLIGEEVRKILKLPLTDGLLVEVIEPGSPAESAGMRGGELEFTLGNLSMLLGGDIVTRINGISTTDAQKIAPVMRNLKVGDTLRMNVFREGETREVVYTLPERPLLPGDVSDEQAGQEQPMFSPRHDKP